MLRPTSPWSDRWAARDASWSLAVHRATDRPWLVLMLVAVSRLGDGLLWYAGMLALPLFGGPSGIACLLRMLAVGVVDLVTYKILKRWVARPRPSVVCDGIRACTYALDQYSFPSGHTLHAVGFSVVLSHYYPPLAPYCWIFAALVSLSRIVLGLHYLSDVAIGAALGASTAMVMFHIF